MTDVVALIASVLQVPAENLSEEDGMHSVPQWDSLKVVLLASMIEVTYDFTLSNSEIEQLITVRGVRDTLARHVGG